MGRAPPRFGRSAPHGPPWPPSRLLVLLTACGLGACTAFAPDAVTEKSAQDAATMDTQDLGVADGTDAQLPDGRTSWPESEPDAWGGDVLVDAPASDVAHERMDVMDVLAVTDVIDAGDAVVAPPEFERAALLETNETALAGLDLESALAMASGAEPLSERGGLAPYHDVFNAFLQPSSGSGGCDAQVLQHGIAAGQLPWFEYGLADFKIECPLPTGAVLTQSPSRWRPLSVANRFDLAPEGGDHCGEQHLTFSYRAEPSDAESYVSEAYLMLSAVVPNPAKSMGLEGCRPLVDFWIQLGKPGLSATVRAQELRSAFVGKAEGPTPLADELKAFGALLGSDKFGKAGRLQLAFVDNKGVWTFSQFRLENGQARRTQLSQSIGVPDLFPGITASLQKTCQKDVIHGLEGLLEDRFALRTIDIPANCEDAENRSTDRTFVETAGPNSWGLLTPLVGFLDAHPSAAITLEELAARADRTGTCVGCHHQRLPVESYQHVARRGNCTDCTELSATLERQLLPFRKKTIQDFWTHPGQHSPSSEATPSKRTIGGALWVQGAP